MQTHSNTLDFKGQKIYVGFDAHLKSWKVTIMTDQIVHKTFSQPPKPEVLHQYLTNNFPGGEYHSAYEAGFCGYWIHNKLNSLGIKSIVVNPADIPTTGKEKVQKEDKRDSRKIARSLRNGELVAIYVPAPKTLEDRSLLRTRTMLVRDMTRYKNRVKSFLHFHGIEIPDIFDKPQSHWSRRFITWLEEIKIAEESGKQSLMILIQQVKLLRLTILKVTGQIRELSRTEAYNKRVKLLRSIPGIGLLTAMMLLTELDTITRFRNIDQLCSFIGFVPSTKSSGEKEKIGEITPRGNSILRTAIIESAWMAVKIDPALMKSYHEYCRRMEPNKAITRIAKKLVSRINFVLKNNQSYKCSVTK
jgi:transposase